MRLAAIIYHLAIACWLGGTSLFTFVLTPIIFKAYSRDIAGGIVGVLFPGYFRWGLACGVVALICLLLTKDRRTFISATIITVMLTITATQAFIIEPKAAALKKEIPSLPAFKISQKASISFAPGNRPAMPMMAMPSKVLPVSVVIVLS